MLKLRWSPAFALVFALALHGCHSPAPGVTADDPAALGRSLATATRDFCVPYVVDGASVDSLAQRPGITARQYSVHGQDVTRYRFDDLPGAPEATPTAAHGCVIQIPEMTASAIPTSVAAFRGDLRLEGYTTSEPHFVPTPGTMVVHQGEPAEPGAPPHSYSTCVHGREHALIQMSGFIVDVSRDRHILVGQGCIPQE